MKPWGVRDLAANLVLTAIACCVALAIVEVALGAMRPTETIGRLPPGQQRYVHHEFEQVSTANAWGLRESGYDPGPATESVLLLGDSFVEGTGQSDEATTAYLLNEHFADRTRQFFNAGVSGTDIEDYRETYRSVRAALDIDFSSVVVVVFLGNDFLDYERVAAVKARARGSADPVRETRLALRIASAILPNTLAFLRSVRGYELEAMEQPYTAASHIDWFNANLDYFGRGPMTEEEVAALEARFARIPADSRELIARGLLNRWTYHVYVTEPLNDFVFNMDSEYNSRLFESTMGALDRLLDEIELPTSVVLIPDKFQVSEAERETASRIAASPEWEDERVGVLEVNRRVLEWLSEHHPDVRVLDLTPTLLERGAKEHYYRIDGHMRPIGAALTAERILELYR